MKTSLKKDVSLVYIFEDFALVMPNYIEKNISDEFVLEFIEMRRATHIQLLSNRYFVLLTFLGYSLYEFKSFNDNTKDKFEVWTKPGKTPPPMYREIVLAVALKM